MKTLWMPAPLDTNEERLTITEIVVHPDYNWITLENDIALLKVSGSFTCSEDKIWPACLPSSQVSFNHFAHIFAEAKNETSPKERSAILIIVGEDERLCWLEGHDCLRLGL